jgi:hypothetical protein
MWLIAPPVSTEHGVPRLKQPTRRISWLAVPA